MEHTEEWVGTEEDTNDASYLAACAMNRTDGYLRKLEDLADSELAEITEANNTYKKTMRATRVAEVQIRLLQGQIASSAVQVLNEKEAVARLKVKQQYLQAKADDNRSTIQTLLAITESIKCDVTYLQRGKGKEVKVLERKNPHAPQGGPQYMVLHDKTAHLSKVAATQKQEIELLSTMLLEQEALYQKDLATRRRELGGYKATMASVLSLIEKEMDKSKAAAEGTVAKLCRLQQSSREILTPYEPECTTLRYEIARLEDAISVMREQRDRDIKMVVSRASEAKHAALEKARELARQEEDVLEQEKAELSDARRLYKAEMARLREKLSRLSKKRECIKGSKQLEVEALANEVAEAKRAMQEVEHMLYSSSTKSAAAGLKARVLAAAKAKQRRAVDTTAAARDAGLIAD